ncbi:Hypothetical predicted protein [Octopus vulgaris]|uniref:Uncharacterized protein n=1 Tax=Octopus vulgaris TaxID=6645 RepID=A0AA36B4R2_OCTVU|nr:Hypothetical predicted protein [Octopus vulgaris]
MIVPSFSRQQAMDKKQSTSSSVYQRGLSFENFSMCEKRIDSTVDRIGEGELLSYHQKAYILEAKEAHYRRSEMAIRSKETFITYLSHIMKHEVRSEKPYFIF